MKQHLADYLAEWHSDDAGNQEVISPVSAAYESGWIDAGARIAELERYCEAWAESDARLKGLLAERDERIENLEAERDRLSEAYRLLAAGSTEVCTCEAVVERDRLREVVREALAFVDRYKYGELDVDEDGADDEVVEDLEHALRAALKSALPGEHRP